MKSNKDEYKKKFSNFSKTEKGKYALIGFFIGFFAGMIWKLIFIIVLAVGGGYVLIKYIKKRGDKNESKKKT